MQTVFNRIEKKYMLNKNQYQSLLKEIHSYMMPDEYGYTSISNIYFDTDNFDLIRKSIDKPIYKEKFRLRSYGIPTLDDSVYLEIKKKYKKIVNKRRIILSLKDFYEQTNNNTQIEKELHYTFSYYHLKPKMFIAYDRNAYYGKDNSGFRIIFDKNIRYRIDDLKLEYGDEGILILPEGTCIMEIKSNLGYSLWFTKILSRLKIYPISFSKYGTAYQKYLKEENYVS